MNKMIKTLAVAAVAAVVTCGSAVAAPRGQAPGGKPPAQQVVHRETPRQQVGQMPQRGHSGAQARLAPQPAPKPQVAHHKSAPRPEPRMAHHKPEPSHEPAPKHHHSSTLHTEDWCSIGASLVGGLIGGLVGAAM